MRSGTPPTMGYLPLHPHLTITSDLQFLVYLPLHPGIVSLIATYHYIRIFNSWSEAFTVASKDGGDYQVQLTGASFNDGYRYVNWLLTVPLLLIELILVMKLPQQETELELEAGLGRRLDGGTGLPRGDPGGSVRAMVLVVLVHDSILLGCVHASRRLVRVHKQTAFSGCSQPCVCCAIPGCAVLVHLPLCVHGQRCRPGRPRGHHVRAGGLLHC
ncbi:unnamed protein product [Polarella glacialis]|uniref:Uncharacterized protein n=1 Tax=Polarella glacialis TaxID=89957 RepID=A0A813KRY9_POLGL|nr:unnamed protein product [Polarella glacialis]